MTKGDAIATCARELLNGNIAKEKDCSCVLCTIDLKILGFGSLLGSGEYP
jgi:hypothetical protein